MMMRRRMEVTMMKRRRKKNRNNKCEDELIKNKLFIENRDYLYLR
jgi:hypothetical protein